MSIWSKLLQVAIVAGAAILAYSSTGMAQENACAAQDLTFRAPNEQPGLVHVTTLAAVGIDQAVARAVGLARGHDRSPEMVPRRDPRPVVVANLDSRFRDPVAEPGKEREAEQRTDDADQDEDRQQLDQ